MNIVEVDDYFFADAGYQINILSKYLQSFGHQVTIISPELDKLPVNLTSFFGQDPDGARDRAYTAAYGVNIKRLPIKKWFSGRAIYDMNQLLSTIHSCHPDVLFCHYNDSAAGMWLLRNRKKLGCPIMMDNHMVLEASENRFAALFRRFYRCFVTPVIRKEQIYVVSLGETRYAEQELGVPHELCPFISFGSDESLFHPSHEARTAFRQKHGISDEAFIVFYAGKLDPAKNGRLLADLTCQKLDTQREIVYVIVGSAVGEYGEDVERRFRESPYRLLRFPTQKYNSLPPFFQASDLAVIPAATSLIVFDLNAAGLPVLAPDHPINVERCAHGNGWTFQDGELQDFRRKLEEILALPDEELHRVSQNAVSYIRKDYSYEAKAREYEKLLEETLSRWQRRK